MRAGSGGDFAIDRKCRTIAALYGAVDELRAERDALLKEMRARDCEQCGGPQVHATICLKCDPDRCPTCGGDGSAREDG